MAHRFSSSTPQPNANLSMPKLSCTTQRSILSSRLKEMHVSLIDPSYDDISSDEAQREIRFSLQSSSPRSDDFIPIDDFSTGFQYESHLGRSCKNVIVVSARHPHSFFLQTVDDLTHCDNFFSKMNEFYNRCFDVQRLAISKAALRTNLCCVTRDEKEPDVWNRAQLLEYHLETDQCSLLLVDLGTWQECVPRSSLRHILVPFCRESVRSVPCRLAGIAPAKAEKNALWNEYAIKTFRNVIENVPTEVEVLERSPNGSYFVNLFVTHETFVCVNDFLLYHKIAIPVDDCKTFKPEELDPITRAPLLAIIYEFKLQGELLAEELKAQRIRHKKSDQSSSSNASLADIKIVPLSLNKNLLFARYKNWILIPWFCISTLFDPALSENTIERFAMLYKFSPVHITPLSEPILCAHLEKYTIELQAQTKHAAKEQQRKLALYSIDCVRKLLLNHQINNEIIFGRLDEAREAEIRNDPEFWQFSPNQSSMEISKVYEENKQSTLALLKSHKNQLEYRLKSILPSNPDYPSFQRQLVDTMEKLSLISTDSNSSF